MAYSRVQKGTGEDLGGASIMGRNVAKKQDEPARFRDRPEIKAMRERAAARKAEMMRPMTLEEKARQLRKRK